MKCLNCNFYKQGHMWNRCDLLDFEYFHTIQNCVFVNDDQTINNEELDKAFNNLINE